MELVGFSDIHPPTSTDKLKGPDVVGLYVYCMLLLIGFVFRPDGPGFVETSEIDWVKWLVMGSIFVGLIFVAASRLRRLYLMAALVVFLAHALGVLVVARQRQNETTGTTGYWAYVADTLGLAIDVARSFVPFYLLWGIMFGHFPEEEPGEGREEEEGRRRESREHLEVLAARSFAIIHRSAWFLAAVVAHQWVQWVRVRDPDGPGVWVLPAYALVFCPVSLVHLHQCLRRRVFPVAELRLIRSFLLMEICSIVVQFIIKVASVGRAGFKEFVMAALLVAFAFTFMLTGIRLSLISRDQFNE